MVALICTIVPFGFKPRAREGRDVGGNLRVADNQLVSSHAPARGATLMSLYFDVLNLCFKPRAREGRDSCVSQ